MVALVKLDTVGKRLLVPIIGLLVALMGVLASVMAVRNAEFAEAVAMSRGEATADLITQVASGHVAFYNLQALDALGAQVMQDPDVPYVAFFDETGKPLTLRAALPEEPADDGTLRRIERAILDEAGRPLGKATLLYSSRRVREAASRNTRVAVVGVTLVLVLMVAGILLIARSILRPIRELTRITRQVVETGDLRLQVRVASRDEVGQLAESFQAMLERWRSALSSLQASSHRLDSSVEALTAATDEQHKTITRQAAALQEAQVTTQEIRQTSLIAAQKAEAVLQAIARADEVSQAGEQAVEESRQGLADIQTQVLLMARRIEQLGDRAKQIAAITGTVKGLADQSNMLALNAAIEAVRSGEAGKGFAVVAREIRSLADQSIDATGRVREILEDLTGAIGEAVRITQEGAQRIAEGLEQVNSSGESMRELSVIVKDNSAAARQIAHAVEQQNAGIAQVSTAVQELSVMMEDTMRRLESTSAASTAIASVSEQAAAVVRDYHV